MRILLRLGGWLTVFTPSILYAQSDYKPIENSLNRVIQLEPYERLELVEPQNLTSGLSTESLEKQFPGLQDQAEGKINHNNQFLVPYLVKAISELNTKLELTQIELNKTKANNMDLRNELIRMQLLEIRISELEKNN